MPRSTSPPPIMIVVALAALGLALATGAVAADNAAPAPTPPSDPAPSSEGKGGDDVDSADAGEEAGHDAHDAHDADDADDADDVGAVDPAVRLLERLEARGRAIRSYIADVVYTREQRILGDRQTRLGKVAYLAPRRPGGDDEAEDDGAAEAGASEKAPNRAPEGPAVNADDGDDGSARFAIRFEKLVVGRALRERPKYFIFDGQWLAEIDPERKQFIRRQVVGPNERFDPLKLGEGPFPLPLGQDKRGVLAVFHARLLPLTDEEEQDRDTEGTRHLRLTPRTTEDGRRKLSDFDRVDIWYDARSLLPRKVVTIEGKIESEANVTTVLLREGRLNTLERAEVRGLFETTPPRRGSGWHVEVKPLDRK